METYRLNSKLVENKKEFLIQTTNDVALGAVSSEVYIDGRLAEKTGLPHPEQIKPEEILSLVKSAHGEKKQEIETLLKAYRAALESGNPEMMYQVGIAFFYRRFYSEARELFLGTVRLNPECHEAYNFLGQTELALGEVDLAVEAARTAVNKRPEYADYRNNLGEAYLAARYCKEAVGEFEKATSVNLYYSDAYYNHGLALILNAIEQQDSALFENVLSRSLDYLTKASLIYPAYKTSEFEKGVESLRSHHLDNAFRLFKRVREEKKEQHRRRYAPFYVKYALSPQWATEKAIGDRISFLLKEINENPTYVDLYMELAQCYLQQSKIIWKKGLEQLKKTLEINPSLTMVDSHLDDAEKAYEEMRQVLDRVAERG